MGLIQLLPRRFHRVVAGSLFFFILPAATVALAAPARQVRSAQPPLTPAEKAGHALNRLTFGARPGDLQRVQAIGVEKWIELQLHPERIDDGVLQQRLAIFPAMHMPLQALIHAYPPPPVIRAVADGKLSLPADPVELAIYQNQLFGLEQRRQAQGAARQPMSGATAATRPLAASGDAKTAEATGVPAAPLPLEEVASSPSMTVHEEKLYTDLASTQVVNLSPGRRFDRLQAMKPAELRGFFKSLTQEERQQLTNGLTAQQKETVVALINPTMLVSGELLQTRLLTDLYSQRQLQAVMTDFWLNHFNVYLQKGQYAPWYLVDYQQSVIAPHAMGKFKDLLVASAESPAMLFYLDNQASAGPHSPAALRARANAAGKNKDMGLNENYARELMELHTLGVGGGYTQKDVTETAKVLTGWTIDDPKSGAGFLFNDRRHEPGPKIIANQAIEAGGEEEGLQVLERLAASPVTARHVSQQLAQRFVSDTPPAVLVDRMVKTWLRSDGDIRKVLETMFHSPEFWSRNAYRSKVKTPEEFVLSAVRATGGEVEQPAAVLNAMSRLGMPFYGCQTPNGYSWNAEAWVNSGDLLSRINIALALAGNKLGTTTDVDALMKIRGANAASAEEKEARLERLFLQGTFSPQLRKAVLQQAEVLQIDSVGMRLGKDAAGRGAKQGGGVFLQVMDLPAPIAEPADKGAALMTGLLLGSPDFQKR